MFKKLIDGELSLKDTFWKFGVLGLFTVHLVVKILGTRLFHKLRGLTIYAYFGNITAACGFAIWRGFL